MEIDRCSRVKFSWGMNSNFDKRFTEQKTVPQTFFQWGEACAVLFTYLSVGMQASREWRDSARLDTSANLHEDQGKSDQLEAVNHGE